MTFPAQGHRAEKLKLGESNLLDHRGVEAVKTAVKPHTLKEKKGESGIRPHPSGASKSRLLGEAAPRTEQLSGGEEGRLVGAAEESRTLGHRPALQ